MDKKLEFSQSKSLEIYANLVVLPGMMIPL